MQFNVVKSSLRIRLLMAMRLHQLPISRALALIFIMVALISSVVIFSASRYIKEYSVSQIASVEAAQTAELIFQSLYSVMKRGWVKQDIEEIVTNVQKTIPDIGILLYRSKKVEALYGPAAGLHHPQQREGHIDDVFGSAEPMLIEEGNMLRFIYPVLARKECLGCHHNSADGDVNGVIEVRMLTDKLRVPLEFTISSVVYLFVATALLLGVIVFLSIRQFLVAPIKELSDYMEIVSDSHDLSKRLPLVNVAFREINGLHKNFNILLGKIEAFQRQLRERSERDPLTGLYNRRKLDEMALLELRRSERHSHQFAVLLIDLNHFKPINDNYGHDAGDELLCEVSDAMLKHIRDEDVLARIGGDEFLVLVTECSEASAEGVVNKIKEVIGRTAIDRNGESLSVGSSIGVAFFPRDGATVEDLIKVADSRMYEDKSADRS
jgi:diguanylate cyclase (GGDEF)-like protein